MLGPRATSRPNSSLYGDRAAIESISAQNLRAILADRASLSSQLEEARRHITRLEHRIASEARRTGLAEAAKKLRVLRAEVEARSAELAVAGEERTRLRRELTILANALAMRESELGLAGPATGADAVGRLRNSLLHAVSQLRFDLEEADLVNGDLRKRCSAAESQVEDLKRQLAAASAAVRAAEDAADDVHLDAASLAERAERAEAAAAAAAEARVGWERRARDAEARANSAENRASNAESRVRDAEQRATEAEGRAREALRGVPELKTRLAQAEELAQSQKMRADEVSAQLKAEMNHSHALEMRLQDLQGDHSPMPILTTVSPPSSLRITAPLLDSVSTLPLTPPFTLPPTTPAAIVPADDPLARARARLARVQARKTADI